MMQLEEGSAITYHTVQCKREKGGPILPEKPAPMVAARGPDLCGASIFSAERTDLVGSVE